MAGLALSKQSVHRAMVEANNIIMESAERVYKDDTATRNAIKVAIDGYEKCLNAYLKLGGK